MPLERKFTRYSGNLNIHLTLTARDKYEVRITQTKGAMWNGESKKLWSGEITPPPAFVVDSNRAIDSAARAAISFADNEVSGIGDLAASGDSDYHVTSNESKRWG